MDSLIALVRFGWLRNLYGAFCRLPVLGTALRRATHRFFPYGTRVWMRVSGGAGKGFWMHLDPRYELDYSRGIWESSIQDCFAEFLKPGDVFYDVGAHIGYFSMVAARIVGGSGAVFSFEPDPDNASCIRRHIERNALSQIEISEAAAWSRSGNLTFRRAIELSSRNMGAVDISSPSDDSNLIHIRAISLDEFSLTRPHPAMIKIDVEGGEIEVLRGATGILKARKPVVLCEAHSPENLDSFNALMLSSGYSVSPVGERRGEFPAHFLAVPNLLKTVNSG